MDNKKNMILYRRLNDITPVSYTHLDVYKRQFLEDVSEQKYQLMQRTYCFITCGATFL